MIINKPWGYEDLIEKNENYTVKKLFMKSGHKCSLQYHNEKHETFFVLSGKLKFYVGITQDLLDEKIFLPGDYYVIPPKLIHRMEAIEDSTYLEASTSQLDDVIRLQDEYKR
jgi:mannose-6-phosphate isomerase-like protein (cupin superfamily)